MTSKRRLHYCLNCNICVDVDVDADADVDVGVISEKQFMSHCKLMSS